MENSDHDNEYYIYEIESRVKVLVESVGGLKAILAGKKIPAILRDQLERFDGWVKDYFEKSKDKASISEVVSSLGFLNIHVSSIISTLKLEDLGVQDNGVKAAIVEALADLNKLLKDRLVVYSPASVMDDFHERAAKLVDSRKVKLNDDLMLNFKKSLDAGLEKTSALEGKVSGLETSVQQSLLNVQELYDSTLVDLKEKKSEIDNLVGLMSGNVVAGSYENSAATEKKMADMLRAASLFCMLIVVVFVGYSFYETTTKGFNWEASLFRLVFSIFLSIPAAYLARESTKHRMQQYSHLQISLDLKAVNPYIASLPEVDQHRLKTEIAGRLFAGKDNERIGSDSYPINTHELLMALIGKMEFKNKNDER